MAVVDTDRVAVLVVRVWVETSGPTLDLRARVTEIPDVARPVHATSDLAFAGAAETCAYVCRWLDRFVGSLPGGAGR